MKNKRTIWALALAGTIGLGIGLLAPSQSHADGGLPACATNGDKDGDGVADEADNDEADSCTASSSGYEDCATGAGDGLPDCQ